MPFDLPDLTRGRFRAAVVRDAAGMAEARALRLCAFGPGAADTDALDAACTHVLLHDTRTGAVAGCFRMLLLNHGGDLRASYSAGFYDLARLAVWPGPMIEIGRFCLHPDCHDPDALRVAWGAITACVDAHGVTMLLGCSSFAGTDPAPYGDAFAWLKARHLAPARWRPGVAAPEVWRYGARLHRRPDPARARAELPPLLRTYLGMGGWVSDHAVIDRRMNTLHVFTGVEIAAIPPARQRLLRAIAAGQAGPSPAPVDAAPKAG
jgi:putative hemolysin